MKKTTAISVAVLSATVASIYFSGYGYIFKALLLNLKKGPLTPSVDDADKFPFNPVYTASPKIWERSADYNQIQLSAPLAKELKKTRTSSLLVAKNGKIHFEKYWRNHDASSLLNSFSMAKGILALLVGCAIEDGYMDSEDVLISDVLTEYKTIEFGRRLTFRHLMTMQAGLDWEEEYHHPFAPNSKQYFVADLGEQTFDLKFKEMPGKKYEYQSAAPQLLGFALRKLINKSLSEYLSEKIWKPMQMESDAKWSTDETGMEKTFCCIHATTRDFARIGQLIIQNGAWEGKQIIDQAYCKRLLTPTVENDAFCYSLWADNNFKTQHRFFYGFLGQFIIVVPEHNLVIVKTGLSNRLEVDDKLRPCQVRKLVAEFC